MSICKKRKQPLLYFMEPWGASKQAVGRLVKVDTKASKLVCGPKSRDRFIRARTASRHLIPRFEPKRDLTHFNL